MKSRTSSLQEALSSFSKKDATKVAKFIKNFGCVGFYARDVILTADNGKALWEKKVE
jgi:hypothetical protein